MNQLSSTESASGEKGGLSRTRLRAIELAVLAGVGIYLCYRLAQPCIPALVWAGALALIFAPLHRWIEARVRRPSVAALLSLAIIGLLVVAPATWFGQKLAEEAITLPQTVQKQLATGKWHHAETEHPLIARFLGVFEQQIGVPENASMASNWLKTFVSKLVKESAIAVIQVTLTLYFLFFFLRDRGAVLKAIRFALPLTEREADTLFARVNDTIHATLYGMLALSALQGVLGGLMFWWLGVPSPWLWALVAALFAFVPVLDTVVLWLPAAIYLGLEGRWGEALGVALLGTLLVRVLANLLYPVLVKHRARAPSVTIFISLLGGVVVFGWNGLVLGPVILTATTTLLEICRSRIGETPGAVRSSDHSRLAPLNSPERGAEAGAAVATLSLDAGKVLKDQMHQA